MSDGEDVMRNRHLEGKSAIITGASSGIGKAVAGCLAQNGCNVFLIARREKQLKEAKQEIASAGVQVEYAVGDVSNENFAKEAVIRAHELFGSLNILVPAAGNAFIKGFAATDIADFSSLLKTNVFGVINFCKEAVKKISRGGSIILITSPAGIYGAKGLSAYAISKGGLVAFGKSLALELAPQKIRVNIVSPGFIPTEMTKALYGSITDKQMEQIKGAHPLGIGSVQDVAKAINFLASDEASWITGVVLPVDGGFTTGI